jgi:cytochrome oxidase assembly protein ShyY1
MSLYRASLRSDNCPTSPEWCPTGLEQVSDSVGIRIGSDAVFALVAHMLRKGGVPPGEFRRARIKTEHYGYFH